MHPSPALPKEAVLLVNSHSLRGADWFETARDRLVDHGVTLTRTVHSKKLSDLLQVAKAERGSGRMILVGGGDGTLSAVANILAKSDSVMGVLPLGTGNAFARDLGIATDIEVAVDVILHGRVVGVDLGVIRDRYFLNVATIGLTSTIARSLTLPIKQRFGRFGYAIALFKAVRKMQPFKTIVQTENGRHEIEVIQLVIGNGRYHAGPLLLAPDASIISGQLHLYAVSFNSTAGLLKYALLLPTGLQGMLNDVYSEDTLGGRIETVPLQSVVIDGEVSDRTPIEFKVDHGALKVIVPTEFTR